MTRARDKDRDRDDDQRHEFRAALKEAEAATQLVEPTDDEIRNGWTAETLTKYLTEQTAAQSLRADPLSAMNRMRARPTRANSRYDPFRRGR